MAEFLVILESPTKAKTVSKFLGSKYKVVASAGHLRDLPASKLAIDIDNDFEPQYTNIRGKTDIIKSLKEEKGKVKKVFLATDPDREGEAISWHLQYLLGIKEDDVCRVTFNEITQKVVLDSIQKPRLIDKGLVDAYQARRVLDRIVGYKISPILWKKVKKGLSAGRVQSVAVRLVCDRENEIENFVPKESWSLDAVFTKPDDKKQIEFTAKYYGEDGKKRQLTTKDEADEVLKALEGAKYVVSDVKLSKKKKSPMPPFITSTLQQEAIRKLNFTSKKTMQVVQGLYEGVTLAGGSTGLVTYIRTDSTRISDEAQNAARNYIESKFGKDYLPGYKRVFKNKNAAQDAHEAIRPTHIDFTPDSIKDKLTNDQYRLYKLIYDRFIASQMADAVYDVCTVSIDAGKYMFKTQGSTIDFAGFTKVYEAYNDKSEEDDLANKLPKLEVSDLLNLVSLKPEQHFTQPPQRYTEATLIKALEDNGIGRPSTYAPTLSVIQERGYVEKDKKFILPSTLGKVVNEYMGKNFSDIVDIEFTANIEDSLDKIAEGEKNWVNVVREFYNDFDKELKTASEESERVKIPDVVSEVACDKCGRMMVVREGRFGKFLACPGYPECKNTKPIVQDVGVPCPECGKKLIFKKTKTGKQFVSCSGYPECKFSTWNIPTDQKCPKCGKYIEKVKGPKSTFFACSNKDCDYKKFMNKKSTSKKSATEDKE